MSGYPFTVPIKISIPVDTVTHAEFVRLNRQIEELKRELGYAKTTIIQEQTRNHDLKLKCKTLEGELRFFLGQPKPKRLRRRTIPDPIKGDFSDKIQAVWDKWKARLA